MLGNELFEVQQKPLDDEYVYLFSQHRKIGFIEAEARFRHKMTFRPHSMQSETHKKLTKAIVERHHKEKRIKIVVTEKDPERIKQEMEAAESERIRAQKKLDSTRKQHHERFSSRRALSEDYLEEDEDEEDEDYDEEAQAQPSGLDALVGRRQDRLSRLQQREADELERDQRILRAKDGSNQDTHVTTESHTDTAKRASTDIHDNENEDNEEEAHEKTKPKKRRVLSDDEDES